MPDFMKTLLLNPPSFDNFDGGASSRWPATREIESYWYPVWLTYPAGMLEGSRLLIEPIPLVIYCPGCQKERAPVSVIELCCPDCLVPAQEIVTGREIEVASLEVAA